MAVALQKWHRMRGVWELSFWSWPDMTAKAIAVQAKGDAAARGGKNPMPHPVIRATSWTTLEGVPGVGDLYASGQDGHYSLPVDVVLPVVLVRPDVEHIKHFAATALADIDRALNGIIDNPAKGAL
jgi:hypothetical protein